MYSINFWNNAEGRIEQCKSDQQNEKIGAEYAKSTKSQITNEKAPAVVGRAPARNPGSRGSIQALIVQDTISGFLRSNPFGQIHALEEEMAYEKNSPATPDEPHKSAPTRASPTILEIFI